MREHYECRRGDALIESTLYATSPSPDAPGDLVRPGPTREVCAKHQCPGTAETMARELDRALAVSVEHERGASVVCSSP